ncbi:TetR/AcrR family transcriptional regulator [Paenibacillus ehimensis]|uniref:TetR/AcrR family transcriptional regulator n=1 Tax=Paenibacillus ehimensis TaxID=79264 RepID=UPI002DB6EEF6|nr:TetR/AcrR family transcriptional regulator [Paenibacillus ehimensis]MEC0213671.1 TetR/AcrR family transcriptional regulator [Paenibacillus ehimensis]
MTSKISLKEKQRRDREQLILDYAEKMLLEKGYHDVSMDEIAAGVGVAKGTLYLHFPKKEDLAYALVKPKMLSFLSSVEEAKAFSGGPIEKLEYLLQRELTGAFFQFLLKSSSDITTIFKSYETEIHEVLSQIFSGIHEILNEGKREGVFDPELPVEFMSSAFINMFEPHLYKEMVVVRRMPLEVYIRHTAILFFQGIMKSKEMK